MAPDKRSESAAGLSKDTSGSRRRFLRTALAASVVLVMGGIAAVAKSLVSPQTPPPTGSASQGSGTNTTSTSSGSVTTASSPFPKFKVANLSDLAKGKPIFFHYPLEETPNMLVKIGTKAAGGVGPDSDVVAFSVLCQHLGCVYGFVAKGESPSCDSYYKADSPVGYCCCHGSVFDLAVGGTVLDGPSPRPSPQVILEVESSSGDIYAVGMTPPSIFGHNTGSDNVLEDLKGGTLVS